MGHKQKSSNNSLSYRFAAINKEVSVPKQVNFQT